MSSANLRDVDALRELDLALDRFSMEGRGPISSMSRSIQETEGMLDERRAHWQAELYRWEGEYSRCRAYTDDEGRPRDCSYEYGMMVAAQRELDTIANLMRMVADAADAQRTASDRFRDALEEGCREARKFVQARIDAAERFGR